MAAATAMVSRRLLTLAAVLVLGVCIPAAAAAAPPQGKVYRVGGEDGWRVPPPEADKVKFYESWASNFTFYVGDSLEFVYTNGSVLRTSKAGYYHCNETAADAAPHDGRTVFVLDAPGFAYFASADLERCSMGERLMVNVLALAAAPSPWPSAPAPWSWVLSPSSSAPAAPSPHSAAAPVASSPSAYAAVAVLVVAGAVAAGWV